jgi:hypothetical protein
LSWTAVHAARSYGPQQPLGSTSRGLRTVLLEGRKPMRVCTMRGRCLASACTSVVVRGCRHALRMNSHASDMESPLARPMEHAGPNPTCRGPRPSSALPGRLETPGDASRFGNGVDGARTGECSQLCMSGRSHCTGLSAEPPRDTRFTLLWNVAPSLDNVTVCRFPRSGLSRRDSGCPSDRLRHSTTSEPSHPWSTDEPPSSIWGFSTWLHASTIAKLWIGRSGLPQGIHPFCGQY